MLVTQLQRSNLLVIVLAAWILVGCTAPTPASVTSVPATVIPIKPSTATAETGATSTQVPAASPTSATSNIDPNEPNSGLTERGAIIFNTGRDPNGQPIAHSGGTMMMMTTSATCATCHGAHGQGLSTPRFVSPNITCRNLTDPAGMIEPDGGHGMKYTDALIRRAVTQGIDPEGQSLDPVMPRWQLTDAEWSALLAYLKTLP